MSGIGGSCTEHGSRGCVAKWAAPALAFATLFVFAPTQALAVTPGSPSCQAITSTPLATTIFPSTGNRYFTGLQAGDRVTITVDFVFPNNPGREPLNVSTDTVGGNSLGTFPPAAGTYGPFIFTAAGDLNIINPAGSLTLGVNLIFSCVGTPSTGPNGPTNSQVLDQTKQTFSKVGAQASATAMGDAASGAIGDAFSGGGTTQIGQGTFSTNFAAIENAQTADGKSALKEDESDPFSALAYKKTRVAYTKAPFKKAPVKLQSQWHVWIDGRFTGFEDKSATSFDGWHNNVTAGASYRFTQNFLAGVLVGYENFKYSMTVAATPTSLNGSGASGGGYFGWKFADRLRLDGMLTYGRIDYGATAGPVAGSFGADRITGMGKLSGRYGFGTFYLEPSAMLTIANERQASFTDTAAVFHDKFNFTVGRASTGGTIGTPMAWRNSVVTPTFGVFADYRFGDETLAAANVVPTFNNGWSAHVNGGLSVAMPNNVTASASGEYGGLGDQIQYWRAKGSLGVKF